jgi:FMN phosphatase YigB (HAD superfamily)
MSRPSIVAFDVGGTLIHPDFAVLREWTIERTETEVSTAVVEQAFRLAIAGDVLAPPSTEIPAQATRFFKHCGCSAALRRLWKSWWQELVASGGSGSWLYRVLDTEANCTLRLLREQGFRLIAASNSNGTLTSELRAFGLLEYFDEVYDSTQLGVEKPSQTFYECLLRDSPDGGVVHVGDDLIKDVIGAAAAGFSRLLLYDPAGIYNGLPSHIRIRRLSEIPAALDVER